MTIAKTATKTAVWTRQLAAKKRSATIAKKPAAKKVAAKKPATSPAPKKLASPYLARTLKERDDALGATLPRVHGATDDEAIHDMRVAIRRMRTILKLARPIYGRFLADAVRRDFTNVQQATGALRDEEVLGETLEGVTVKDAPFITWRKRRHLRDRALRATVVQSLREGALDRARKMLEALIALPVKPSRDAELTKFARKSVERAEKEVERKSDVSPDDTVALHDLRIAYKNLRYCIEIFEEALPPAIAATLKSAVQFQKRLGEIHDHDVALDTVGRARGLPPATRDRVVKELKKQREELVGRFFVLSARARAGERDVTASAPPPPKAAAKKSPAAASKSAKKAVTRARPVRPSASSRSGKSRPS